MVLDLLTGLVIAIGAGGALGAFSALLGWASNNEPFEPKKFSIGVATGVVAGIAIVFLSFSALKTALTTDPTGLMAFELMIPIAISIVGTDQIRAKISSMVANRNEPTTTTVIKT